jgi:hypothetical protein
MGICATSEPIVITWKQKLICFFDFGGDCDKYLDDRLFDFLGIRVLGRYRK